jgi:hypothetical protein
MFTSILGAGLISGSCPSHAFAQSIDLGTLNGTDGFAFHGKAGDRSAISVSGGGDFNGDGLGDVIVGGDVNSTFGQASGVAYVVWGNSTSTTSSLTPPDLEAGRGLRVLGTVEWAEVGRSVANAGDVNADGFDDMIIGAPDTGQVSPVGDAYVVFGRNTFTSHTFELSELTTETGFILRGESISDFAGFRVAGAGDINGDGIGDILVSAMVASAANGIVYVVFGASAPKPDLVVPLASLDGTNGYKIMGESAGLLCGRGLAKAGDVNGDGFDDIILGAPGSYMSTTYAGAAYIVFGTSAPTTIPLELSTLPPERGIKLQGENTDDSCGRSVAGAGDVNGDGFSDVIIGAPLNDETDFQSGAAYVVFGRNAFTTGPIALSALNGSDGFKILGADFFDKAGISVSTAGDFNGDGISDVLIGAYTAYSAYIVFGRNGPFDAKLNLGALNGVNGLKFSNDRDNRAGYSLSAAGDVNGDGFDDVIVGAFGSHINGDMSGSSYVVYSPVLDVTKLKIGLNFSSPAKDRIKLTGLVDIPAGFQPDGRILSVDVGGTSKQLTMLSNGKGKSGFDSSKLKIKKTDGTMATPQAKFSVSLKKGDFASALADDGLINDTLTTATSVNVSLGIDNQFRYRTVPLQYKAIQGKSGKAKN